MKSGRLPAFVILIVLGVAVVGLLAVGHASDSAHLESVGTVWVEQVSFTLVGAWILFARRGNRMGWLFAVVGLLATTGQLAHAYSLYRVVEGPADVSSLTMAAAWYAEWYWMPWLFLFLSGTSLLFPTGTPLSPRWSRVAWTIAIAAAALTVATALDPVLNVDPLRGDAGSVAELPNPVGVSPLGDPDDPPLVFLFLPLLSVSAVSAVVSLVLRFKRSRGDERQQMKWFVYGAVVMVGGFVLFGGLDGFGYDLPSAVEGLLQMTLPMAAAIGILRYRLYDIDLIVNRTLVYGALTAVLALAYLGLVVLLQSGLSPFTAESDVAVAGSTLAVAALFRPARVRVQEFIDRRFYRQKYDAAEALRMFSSRLRDQVDLDSINTQMLDVIQETIQPLHASVWLRARAKS